jgi:hypothetical protein
VPPGALAYPKYKIVTLSFALFDVELHRLDKDIHCSPRQMHQEDADKRSRRGTWTRVTKLAVGGNERVRSRRRSALSRIHLRAAQSRRDWTFCDLLGTSLLTTYLAMPRVEHLLLTPLYIRIYYR